MKRAVISSCKQAFSGAGFLLAAAGTVLVLALGVTDDLITAFRSETLLLNGYHWTLLQTALTSDAMTLALPILSALPFTSSYIDDLRSGFLKEYLPRTKRGDYIAGKLAACSLSGALALVLGIVLAGGLFALVFLPMEAALEEGAEAMPWLEALLSKCALFFCSGAFWALVGMTASAVTSSKYMAYAAPFILYYVMIILCERYFGWLYVFYPKEWINPTEWAGGGWGVALLLLELMLLTGGAFALIAKRRLEQI